MELLKVHIWNFDHFKKCSFRFLKPILIFLQVDNLIGHFSMVLQFAEDGNLHEYLKIKFSILKWKDKLNIAKEIAQGLVFLHDNNIVHRDLVSK